MCVYTYIYIDIHEPLTDKLLNNPMKCLLTIVFSLGSIANITVRNRWCQKMPRWALCSQRVPARRRKQSQSQSKGKSNIKGESQGKDGAEAPSCCSSVAQSRGCKV